MTTPAAVATVSEATEAANAKAKSEEARAKKAREDAAAAEEAAKVAKRNAAETEASEERRKNMAAAAKALRAASPDKPLPLRRVEMLERVGDTLYGQPTNAIDSRNSTYRDVSLLWDGEACHVVNAKDASKSFMIGYGNIAAMYPLIEK